MRQEVSEILSQLCCADGTEEPMSVEGILGKQLLTAPRGSLRKFSYLVRFRNQQRRRTCRLLYA